MKKLKNALTASILLIAIFLTAATAYAAEASGKKSEAKAPREKAGLTKAEKAPKAAEEIVPDDALESDETNEAGEPCDKTEGKSPENERTGTGGGDGKASTKSGSGFSFSYNAESRIDKMSRERIKSKNFLEKISNEFFKIYADEDDFTVIAEFPFGKDDTAYSYKFKDEFQLVLTFTHKSDKSKKPVRYEITFPEPTKKEAFDFTVREKLELNVPIDFFYIERKNLR